MTDDRKVVNLSVAPIPGHPGLIACLEDLLAEARAGNVVAVAMLIERPEKGITYQAAGVLGSVAESIGRIEIIKSELLRDLFSSEEE